MAYTKRQQQIADIVKLQHSMNSIVNPNWVNARYPFLRAAMVEAVEAIEHYGYKWWKKETPDLKQVQMEVVDMVHFMISDYIVEKTFYASWDTTEEEIFENVIEEIEYDLDNNWFQHNSVVEQLQRIVELSARGTNAFPELIALLPMVDMNWEKLYLMYVGKNALNTFRQDNGYTDGTYKKVWNNREDNEHLYEIIEELEKNLTTTNTFDTIYKLLSQRYNSI